MLSLEGIKLQLPFISGQDWMLKAGLFVSIKFLGETMHNRLHVMQKPSSVFSIHELI